MMSQKLLACYSGAVTAVAAVMILTGATTDRREKFDEIDVQRINIRERDGTLRMSLSGRDRLGGVIIRGVEHDFPRDQAGIIFFNDEGSETGGLIFGGRDNEGKPVSSGSLTFDRYEQDQVIQMLQREEGEDRFSGLLVTDRPDGRLDFAALKKASELRGIERRQAIAAANAGETHRIVVGRESDKSAQVGLKDEKGRTRLLMRVEANGAATIQFLDESGRVVRSLTP